MAPASFGLFTASFSRRHTERRDTGAKSAASSAGAVEPNGPAAQPPSEAARRPDARQVRSSRMALTDILFPQASG